MNNQQKKDNTVREKIKNRIDKICNAFAPMVSLAQLENFKKEVKCVCDFISENMTCIDNEDDVKTIIDKLNHAKTLSEGVNHNKVREVLTKLKELFSSYK